MTRADSAAFLRLALRGNAVFSAICGASMWLCSGPLGAWLGVEPASLVAITAVDLLGFAALLVWLASRDEIPASPARAVVVADLLWVAATAVLVPLGTFSESGGWLAIAVADVVFAFALLQWIGIRRMQRRSGTARA